MVGEKNRRANLFSSAEVWNSRNSQLCLSTLAFLAPWRGDPGFPVAAPLKELHGSAC